MSLLAHRLIGLESYMKFCLKIYIHKHIDLDTQVYETHAPKHFPTHQPKLDMYSTHIDHPKSVIFPSFFIHCFQCIIYLYTIKFVKKLKILLPHGIFILLCIIMKIKIHLHLYQSDSSKNFHIPIQMPLTKKQKIHLNSTYFRAKASFTCLPIEILDKSSIMTYTHQR